MQSLPALLQLLALAVPLCLQLNKGANSVVSFAGWSQVAVSTSSTRDCADLDSRLWAVPHAR